MSNSKYVRARLSELEALDITVLDIRQGKHICIRVQNAQGRVTTLALSRSPSDWRGDKNWVAQATRFAAQN